MATMKLQRVSDFKSAIILGDDLDQSLAISPLFEQPVVITRQNGDNELLDSLIKRDGDKAQIVVTRLSTGKRVDAWVPVTTSPLDAEEMILSLALELLLS